MPNELNLVAQIIQDPTIIQNLGEEGIFYVTLGRPAAKAIARLISGVVDIPVTYLKSVQQGIQDNIDARSMLNNAVSQAASTCAKENPALASRAVDCWLSGEIRKQQNREAIAQKTIDILKDDPVPLTSGDGPSEDFMNFFEDACSKASSEELRDLLARVLFGEIRKPHTFSRRTIQFITTIDQDLADIIQQFRNWLCNDRFVILTPNFLEGTLLERTQLLDDCGIVQFDINLQNRVDFSDSKHYLLFGRRGIRLTSVKQEIVNINSIILTPLGQQIMSLLPQVDDNKMNRIFAEYLASKEEFSEVELFDILARDQEKFSGENFEQVVVPKVKNSSFLMTG